MHDGDSHTLISHISFFLLLFQSEKEDDFGWSRLITAGLKIALTLLTAPPSDGIDKSDDGGVGGGSDVPTQAILGTLISAVTGSEDPKEVAKMARQATEVRSRVHKQRKERSCSRFSRHGNYSRYS